MGSINITQAGSSYSYLQMDGWYVGLSVDANGDLFVYIDSDYGAVTMCDEDLAEDEYQWGRRFVTGRRTWTRSGMRRNVKVQVKKKDN